jgi:hypothetical protein
MTDSIFKSSQVSNSLFQNSMENSLLILLISVFFFLPSNKDTSGTGAFLDCVCISPILLY